MGRAAAAAAAVAEIIRSSSSNSSSSSRVALSFKQTHRDCYDLFVSSSVTSVSLSPVGDMRK